MSQHPQSPYPPPPGGYPQQPPLNYGQPYPYPQPAYGYGGNPLDNLLSPARRAMWLMLILGIVTVLFGGCFSIAGAMWPEFVKNMPQEQQAEFQKLEQQLQGVRFEHYLLAAGVIVLVVGIVHVALSFVVRRGTLMPVVLGIMLTGIILVLLLISTIMNLFNGQAVGGMCFGVPGLALWGLLLVWLIQAAGRAGQVAAMRAAGYGGAVGPQYGSQYWQFQQPGQPQPPQPQPPPGYGFPPPPPPGSGEVGR